jgi:hypothetical protein
MIGDLIIWIKKIIKQLTCIHEYKHQTDPLMTRDWYVCIKCDKLK